MVNAAKRHRAYRSHRSSLQSLVPCDIWPDFAQGVHVVIFSMDRNHEEERHLAFAVDSESLEVVSTGILVLTVSPEGWTIRALTALD